MVNEEKYFYEPNYGIEFNSRCVAHLYALFVVHLCDFVIQKKFNGIQNI